MQRSPSSTSSISHQASPISAPMSAVISVLPSGASHGIDCGVSVSRKNGYFASGVHVIVSGSRLRPLHAEVDEDHRAEPERAERLERVGALDEAGQHVDRRGAHHRGGRDLLARDADADRAVAAHGDALDRALQPDRVGDVRGEACCTRWRSRARDRRARRWRSAAPRGRTRSRRRGGSGAPRASGRPSARCRSGSCRRRRARARTPARRTTPRAAAARSRRRAQCRSRAGTGRPRTWPDPVGRFGPARPAPRRRSAAP